MHSQKNFMGKEFFWWQGVVEDRHDENAKDGLKLGRCRVRILGLHSPFYMADDPNGEGIRPDELHWAYPMTPINSASIDGIGETPMGPVEGTWVFGFSRDGEFSQELVIMGTFGSNQTEQKNPMYEGFCDPELSGMPPPPRPMGLGHIPPYPAQVGESSVNRLARNEIPHDIIEIKEAHRIPFLFNLIALDGFWIQPDIQYNAMYPYNHVKESESGHIEEWDDTPGEERTHKYHKSSSYVETYKNGDRTQQTWGSDHETILKDKHIISYGNTTITAYGDVKILSTLGNVDIQSLTQDVNIVASRSINLIAPSINEISNTHTITTSSLLIQAGVTNLTTGAFNIIAPVTNIYGSLFVEFNTQSTTITTTLLASAGIITGWCKGC